MDFETTQPIDPRVLTERLAARIDFESILKFVTSPNARAVASLMRRTYRTELALTPIHRAGNDRVELRMGSDGILTCVHRCGADVFRTRLIDRPSIETSVPPAAARGFALALENNRLWETVSAGLELRRGAPAV